METDAHLRVENSADMVQTVPERRPAATFMMKCQRMEVSLHQLQLDFDHQETMRIMRRLRVSLETKRENPDKSHASKATNAQTVSANMLMIQMLVPADHQRSHASREETAETLNAGTATTAWKFNSNKDPKESKTPASKALLAPNLTVHTAMIQMPPQFKLRKPADLVQPALSLAAHITTIPMPLKRRLEVLEPEEGETSLSVELTHRNHLTPKLKPRNTTASFVPQRPRLP